MVSKKQPKVDPPSGESAISTRAEQKQVEERQAIGAHVVYEAIRREGEEELHRPAAALAWSAFAAGLSMGFSFIAEGVLRAHLPDQTICPSEHHCHRDLRFNPETIVRYRQKWVRRVKAISKEGGWDWEYHLGKFRPSPR